MMRKSHGDQELRVLRQVFKQIKAVCAGVANVFLSLRAQDLDMGLVFRALRMV